jgi:NitT/TauT family transport system permease protein
MTTTTTTPRLSRLPSFGRRGQATRTGRRVQPEFLAVPLLLLALWEAAVATGILDARLIPAPHTVAQTWWTWVVGGSAANHDPYAGTWGLAVLASTQRVFLGFLIAGLAGTAIGLLIGWFRLPRVLMQPVIDILRPIPVTAWVPFAVVFFGIRPAASVSLIALGSFFPIALNAAAGAVGTPRVLVSAAQMLGTSRRQILWRVVLPSSLPSIVT